MESRKSSLASQEVCRFCLTHNSLSSLYDRSKRPNYLSDLPTQILSCVSVEVFPSDGMPTYICDRCRFFMSISYQFKKICRQGDESIMQYVQKGQALQPVNWPVRLKKLYQINNNPVKPEVKTTVVTEEGTCVEVTSQDHSESEEDEDESSVYVKIEPDATQGSDQGMANIQLVSPNEKSVKEKLKKQSKGQANVKKNDVSIPCQYCEKSFALNKNYIRHLALKHKDAQPSHAPYGECEQFCCDQCNEIFYTQDELIYHSAVHATKNLTCPLCHEKFDDVDAITVHIESHVDGVEFICEECRLVFSSKENLKAHMEKHHGMMTETTLEDEEEGTEVEFEEGEDYNFSVKEEGDHMVVQLKKPDNFMLSNPDNIEKEMTEEESFAEDVDVPYMNTSSIKMEMANVTPVKIKSPNVTPVKQHIQVAKASPTKKNVVAMAAKVQSEQEPNKSAEKVSADAKAQTASILRKAEEMKRKSQLKKVETPVSDKTSTNAGTSTPTGASDKSLKLLEKELQELKRTSNRGESVKTPTKGEILRGRRTQQLITSTPKPKSTEDRSGTRTPTIEKKPVERRSIPTKENQEPKETKEKINVSKEDKTTKQNNNNTSKVKEQPKDVKTVKEDKVSKEQKTKTVDNNGAADRNSIDENIRRSHRSTKVKDYAKMVKDATSEESDDDEEYIEGGNTPEARTKTKKVVKPKTPTSQQASKKRGRPRKDVKVEVPAKIMKTTTPKSTKEDESMETEEKAVEDNKIDTTPNAEPPASETESQNNQTPVPSQTASPAKAGTILLSPSGQPLRKVQTLPPGVKPIPLPVGARSTLCEMQIGTKFVKVQRIMMTKAEVEDMAKKGLVEMKDGTMVLKQGVKMATPTGEQPQPVPAVAAPKVTTEMKGET